MKKQVYSKFLALICFLFLFVSVIKARKCLPGNIRGKKSPLGQCNTENDSDCSPPVSRHTKATILTLNRFEARGGGGDPSESDEQYHSDGGDDKTGTFDNKKGCRNPPPVPPCTNTTCGGRSESDDDQYHSDGGDDKTGTFDNKKECLKPAPVPPCTNTTCGARSESDNDQYHSDVGDDKTGTFDNKKGCPKLAPVPPCTNTTCGARSESDDDQYHSEGGDDKMEMFNNKKGCLKHDNPPSPPSPLPSAPPCQNATCPPGPSESDDQYHSDDKTVVALSTGCINNIHGNGKSVRAKVVDGCDFTGCCKNKSQLSQPCNCTTCDLCG
ncbi:hypothetical protein PTKIN_Ptkin14bG0165400 [Pterospermum kingtungense]